MSIYVSGKHFCDEYGRIVLLRGVNVGGSSKVPQSPCGATWQPDGFFAHRQISFVGRPFSLSEAPEHLERLRAWGLHFLRWVITWEAVEHAGPGIYDQDYLDYLEQIMEMAQRYGMQVWIDPHQDVWSRWTGGDGAPGWTLEEIGFDLTQLHPTGSAIIHHLQEGPLPTMIWPTNHDKLGTATMFSLFFAGNDMAPRTQIRGESAQEFLQRHFIQAMQQVARRLQRFPHIVGYGTLNEPGRGWIGLSLPDSPPSVLRKGPTPTPWQAILLGAGYPQRVDVMEPGPEGPDKVSETVLNPQGASVWRSSFACPWKQNGVWTDATGTPELLAPQHFRQRHGKPVDFANDYLKPFLLRYIQQIREPAPKTMVFVEGIPFAKPPRWTESDPQQVVHGVHWYDGIPLIMKTYNPAFTFDALANTMVMGEEEVRQSYARQLATLQDETRDLMRDMPVCVGEFGLPFDLEDKAAYKTGDFSPHIQALDAYFSAMEQLFLSCTLWNYTADNSNAHGDQWNDEDLSIFSPDQRTEPRALHSGGRALQAIVRPYPKAVAGHDIAYSFDIHRREFHLTFLPLPDLSIPTEIFVPAWVYLGGADIQFSSERFEYNVITGQLLLFAGSSAKQTLLIRPQTRPR